MATVFLVGTVVVLLIVWLNVWNYRRRALMTPAEREAEDAETSYEMNIW